MRAALSTFETRLLNAFQRDFPLAERPFAAIAHALGTDERRVQETFARRIADGTVSRIGAVFRPGAIGASTLAAMAVPEARLEAVAAIVSARPEVNHNYEREHAFNLWFVVAARDGATVAATLEGVRRDTGLPAIALPLVRDYAIDLGFDFAAAGPADPPARREVARGPVPLGPADEALLAALERGLPCEARPYAALARAAGWRESAVRERLAEWIADGAIQRFGVVVRHRRLGFEANAMCAWDVPDGEVDARGAALSREPGVTLCYRRARAQDWRYNLFAMVHGRERERVRAQVDGMGARHGLAAYPGAVLFSRRAFKQCGARYFSAAISGARNSASAEPLAASG